MDTLAEAAAHERVERVALGRVGFGGAPLGNLYAALADADATATLERAWSRGIRHFDTAPHYGSGLSERRLGDFLRRQHRDDFILSTKVGRLLRPDVHAAQDQNGYYGALPFVARYDYSADGARRSLEDSLQRMGLARVDIVYVHDIDVRTHGAAQPARYREAITGALPALTRLREQGVIGALGLGVNEWEVCRDALRDADIDCLLLAGRYSLLDQSALPVLLPLCAQRGTAVVIGGPYNSGILATGAVHGARYDYQEAPAAIVERVRLIEAIGRRYAVPLRAAALQFPLAHPAVRSVIPGARSTAEIDDAIDMMNVEIPADYWRALIDAQLLPAQAPLPA